MQSKEFSVTKTVTEKEIKKVRVIRAYYKNGSTKFIGVVSDIEKITIEDTEGNILSEIENN